MRFRPQARRAYYRRGFHEGPVRTFRPFAARALAIRVFRSPPAGPAAFLGSVLSKRSRAIGGGRPTVRRRGGVEGAISLGFAALVSPGKTGALAIPPSILLLATVARGTLQVVIAQSSIAVLERWRWRLRTHLVDRIFDDLTTASLVDAEVRLADGHHKAAAFVYQSAGLVPQLALASSITAILLWLSPLRALVVFATLGASAGLALTFTRRQSRRHIPRLRELHRAFHRGLIRVLRNGAAVRAYGTERDEHRSLHDTVRQSAELSERLQRGIQAIGIVPGLGLSLVLLAAIVHAPEGARASLLAFGLLSLRLGGLLGTMSKTGAHLQATYPFFREAVGDVRRQ